jgi:hypothetical protein
MTSSYSNFNYQPRKNNNDVRVIVEPQKPSSNRSKQETNGALAVGAGVAASGLVTGAGLLMPERDMFVVEDNATYKNHPNVESVSIEENGRRVFVKTAGDDYKVFRFAKNPVDDKLEQVHEKTRSVPNGILGRMTEIQEAGQIKKGDFIFYKPDKDWAEKAFPNLTPEQKATLNKLNHLHIEFPDDLTSGPTDVTLRYYTVDGDNISSEITALENHLPKVEAFFKERAQESLEFYKSPQTALADLKNWGIGVKKTRPWQVIIGAAIGVGILTSAIGAFVFKKPKKEAKTD